MEPLLNTIPYVKLFAYHMAVILGSADGQAEEFAKGDCEQSEKVICQIVRKKSSSKIGGVRCGRAIAMEALKQHCDVLDISSIVFDGRFGGSSGRLRQKFKTLPPGDIIRADISHVNL